MSKLSWNRPGLPGSIDISPAATPINYRSGLLHRVGVVWSQTLQLLKQMEMDEVPADLQSFSVAWPFFCRKMVDLVPKLPSCGFCKILSLPFYSLVEKLRRNQPHKNGREPKTLTKKGTLVHRGLLGFGLGVYDIGEGCNLCNPWGDSMAGTLCQAQTACALCAISKYVCAQNAWTPWACEQVIKSLQYIYIEIYTHTFGSIVTTSLRPHWNHG